MSFDSISCEINRNSPVSDFWQLFRAVVYVNVAAFNYVIVIRLLSSS